MEESASAEIQEVNALIINVNEISESEREAKSPSGYESRNREVNREARNGEVINREANASGGNQHQDKVLANNITKMFESLEPPISRECCIYRVPYEIRKLKEEAYTPKAISIGPFHHGNERLEAMEKLKVRYCKIFVERVKLNVEKLVNTIRDWERDVRRCYEETSKLSSDNYVTMILLDVSFIIVCFLIHIKEWSSHDDLIVLTQRLQYIVFKDMQLLENQLPFFIIEELYNFAFPSHSRSHSFAQLAVNFLARSRNARKIYSDPDLKIKHFTDFLRTAFLPASQMLPPRKNGEKVMHLYTVSQLHEAGMKFKVGSRECLFDLKFTNKVLEIPQLTLYNETQPLFRNLIALEQCHYLTEAYFTDYIRILDFLINTPKDVDLLVQKGILINYLGDNHAVATLVNNLCKQVLYIDMNSYYCNLCDNLNKFYEDTWHRRKAILRRDYFSIPWRTASTVAAIILLLLTFIQTVRSFY